ncbi:MAG: VRR-NUC domain-containing protein [Clostridium sp.]
MAAEKQFENQIKKFLDKLPDTWYFKVWSGPYSKSGIPDIIACINGNFVALEVKAENGRASELQKRNIRVINECNGLGLIVYPSDFEKLKETLLELCKN